MGKCVSPKSRYAGHAAKQQGTYHRAKWLNMLHSLNLKPIMGIVAECDEAVWEEQEIYWINYYRDILNCSLVNTVGGGAGKPSGVVPKEETLRKMSEAMKGEKNPFYGKKHNTESLSRMSEAHKGHKHTEETKHKMSLAGKGNTRVLGKRWELSKETKLKQGKAKQGKNSKLSSGDVIEIKRLLEEGEKQGKIATMFGVDSSTISCIHTKKKWAWLSD